MQISNSNVARTLREPPGVGNCSIDQLWLKQPPAPVEQRPPRRLAPSWADVIAIIAIGLLIYLVGKMFWTAFWLRF